MPILNSQPVLPDSAASSEQNNTKNFKSFWPIVAVIVVALIAGGAIAYYAYGNILQDQIDSLILANHFTSLKHLKPFNTDQAVWKTYKNDQYGFQFQYPNDWQVFADQSQKQFLVNVNPIGSPNSCGGLDILILNAKDKAGYIQQLSEDHNEVIADGSVNMGKYVGQIFNVHDLVAGPGAGVSTLEVLDHGNYSFLLSFSQECFHDTGNKDYTDITSKIISSFRFVE